MPFLLYVTYITTEEKRMAEIILCNSFNKALLDNQLDVFKATKALLVMARAMPFLVEEELLFLYSLPVIENLYIQPIYDARHKYKIVGVKWVAKK